LVSEKAIAWLMAACAILLLFTAGCGLQTDEANKYLEKANAHQQEAEANIAKLKTLPGEWEKNFAAWTIGPTQVDGGRALIKAREVDLDALDVALEEWLKDIKAIQKLDVDEKIKEFSGLKVASIKQWQGYSEMCLRPLVKAYGGLLETIALNRPLVEQQDAATDITNLVAEATSKLEECLASEKQTDNFFKVNKLGK